MPQRKNLARLFNSSEYRLFVPHNYLNTDSDGITYYLKKNFNSAIRRNTVSSKKNLTLLKAAGVLAHLEYCAGLSNPVLHNKDSKLLCLPKELLLQALKYLPIKDICSFAQSSRYSRLISYDNLLWKTICHRVWHDPSFMFVDIASARLSLRLWYNWKLKPAQHLNTATVFNIFEANFWRVVFIAINTLNLIPSIVISPEPNVFPRTTECFPTNRTIQYKCSKGNFTLQGINQVGQIEYIVFNNFLQPWHKREYLSISPLSIFCLKDYGLKQTRNCRRPQGTAFFRRRGYYIKTDENQKVHITYRYFPTVRFRLFKQRKHAFLLCHDIFVSGGVNTNCYTLYQIVHHTTSQFANDSQSSSFLNTAIACDQPSCLTEGLYQNCCTSFSEESERQSIKNVTSIDVHNVTINDSNNTNNVSH